MLLQNGANPAATNKQNETPLHSTVAEFYHKETVQLLLQRGAVADVQDNQQNTPLHRLLLQQAEPARQPSDEWASVALALTQKTNLDLQNAAGATALSLATQMYLRHGLSEATAEAYAWVIEKMLNKAGTNPNLGPAAASAIDLFKKRGAWDDRSQRLLSLMQSKTIP